MRNKCDRNKPTRELTLTNSKVKKYTEFQDQSVSATWAELRCFVHPVTVTYHTYHCNLSTHISHVSGGMVYPGKTTLASTYSHSCLPLLYMTIFKCRVKVCFFLLIQMNVISALIALFLPLKAYNYGNIIFFGCRNFEWKSNLNHPWKDSSYNKVRWGGNHSLTQTQMFTSCISIIILVQSLEAFYYMYIL